MRLFALTAFLSIVLVGCATTEESAKKPVMMGQSDDAAAQPKAMYPGDGETAEGEAEEDGEDVICRMEAVTGSAIKKRVCTTRKQREAMRKGAEGFYRKFQRHSGGSPNNQ